jgi:hypothetical protein
MSAHESPQAKGRHVRVSIEQARTLVDRAMRAVEHDADEARLIADHLICLTPADDFARTVAGYAQAVRSARPVAGGLPVRMPFDRSPAERAHRPAPEAPRLDHRMIERTPNAAAPGDDPRNTCGRYPVARA